MVEVPSRSMSLGHGLPSLGELDRAPGLGVDREPRVSSTFGRVLDYSIADEVGRVELDGGEIVKFGRGALGDVVPLTGARVEAIELAAHPLGGRRALRLASVGTPATSTALHEALASRSAEHDDESEAQLLRMRRGSADGRERAESAAASAERARVASLAAVVRPFAARGDEVGAWRAALLAAGLAEPTALRLLALARPALRLELGVDPSATSWLDGARGRPPADVGAGLVPFGHLDLTTEETAALGLPASRLTFLGDPAAQPWSRSDRSFAVVEVGERRTAGEAGGRPLALRSELTMPRAGALELAALSASELDVYVRATQAVHAAAARPYAVGQLGGYPDPVAGPMEPECERLRRAPDAASSGEVAPWRLVLQLECTREGPLPMWADVGCLYFWIRGDDLAARRWSAACGVLQCH